MVSMSLKKVSLAVALALGVCAGANAATLSVAGLSITGGDFGMGSPGGNTISAGPSAPIVAGTYQGAGSAAAALATFQFGPFGPVYTYTAASVAGVAGGGPAPAGTVDTVAGTITMDMSSWFAFWNGNDFNQGATATGTYNAGTGAYSMSWNKTIVGGPFNGQTGYWHLTGVATTNAAPVPLPAAAWLMGSGLLGLVGVARRRKAAEA